jgi:hypothetical protein
MFPGNKFELDGWIDGSVDKWENSGLNANNTKRQVFSRKKTHKMHGEVGELTIEDGTG